VTVRGPEHGRTLVVVSPVSGSGRARRAARAVLDVLIAQGRDPELVETSSGSHAEDLAAGAEPQDLVVSVGGDGLHGRVAAGAVPSGCLVAPIPGGRGNDLARALGVPSDPVAATHALAVAAERRIDVGQVGDTVFLGVASVGFDTVANTIANETTWLRGPLVYAWGGMRGLLATRRHAFRVTTDGATTQVAGYNVAVGNSGRYGGGMRACPEASLDDGLLDVVTIGAVGRAGLVPILLRAFPGSHVRDPGVQTRRATHVRIEADEPLVVFADGDPVGLLPVDVTTRPAALRVLC
jgi:YegS/Rv2252/BmrU family lipid kinase